MYYINIKISRRVPVFKSLHAHDVMKITITAVKQPKNESHVTPTGFEELSGCMQMFEKFSSCENSAALFRHHKYLRTVILLVG